MDARHTKKTTSAGVRVTLLLWWFFGKLVEQDGSKAHKKPPPQFTNVNEEVVCRSVTKQTLVI
jgi:hypothetical protein